MCNVLVCCDIRWPRSFYRTNVRAVINRMLFARGRLRGIGGAGQAGWPTGRVKKPMEIRMETLIVVHRRYSCLLILTEDYSAERSSISNLATQFLLQMFDLLREILNLSFRFGWSVDTFLCCLTLQP